MKKLLILLMLIGVAGAVPTGVPYELDGKSCFLDEAGVKPLYFCQCVDTPQILKPEAKNQLLFQMTQAILGISQDSKDGSLVVKKLALFQVVHADGQTERRVTERIIPFHGVKFKPPGLHVSSDEPAQGVAGSRTTVLHLEPDSDKGWIRVELWPTSDRKGKPTFDHTYPLRYKKM